MSRLQKVNFSVRGPCGDIHDKYVKREDGVFPAPSRAQSWWRFMSIPFSPVFLITLGYLITQLSECQWPKNLIHFRTTKLIHLTSS